MIPFTVDEVSLQRAVGIPLLGDHVLEPGSYASTVLSGVEKKPKVPPIASTVPLLADAVSPNLGLCRDAFVDHKLLTGLVGFDGCNFVPSESRAPAACSSTYGQKRVVHRGAAEPSTRSRDLAAGGTYKCSQCGDNRADSSVGFPNHHASPSKRIVTERRSPWSLRPALPARLLCLLFSIAVV